LNVHDNEMDDNEHGRMGLDMTQPVGGAASEVLRELLVQADAKVHAGAIDGSLPHGLFVAELREAGVRVSGDEAEALAVAFADWQRNVDYEKWWRSLGVSNWRASERASERVSE
jgi:hypothetical protein